MRISKQLMRGGPRTVPALKPICSTAGSRMRSNRLQISPNVFSCHLKAADFRFATFGLALASGQLTVPSSRSVQTWCWSFPFAIWLNKTSRRMISDFSPLPNPNPQEYDHEQR